VRLLELVQQHDRERVAPDGRDQRGALGLLERVSQQSLQAVRRLELAHVQADEAVGRTEEELRERLRQLRLAGTGRADEEEDAEWPGRVRQAGLDERDPFDEAVDRFRLAHDPAREEGPDLLEVERRLRIESSAPTRLREC